MKETGTKGAIQAYLFRAVIEEDPFEDGTIAYHAYCPALRAHGASTWGYTREEALENLQEVVRLVIAGMIKHGEPIPAEPEGDVRVSPGPLVAINVPNESD